MWIVILAIEVVALYAAWKILRYFYIKDIFDKIESVDLRLCDISRRIAMLSRNEYSTKTVYTEEQYNVLKDLTENLLKSKCWIQNYLMTTKERQRYEEVFKRLVNTEKEMVSCYLFELSEENNDTEMICSSWYNNWLHSTR